LIKRNSQGRKFLQPKAANPVTAKGLGKRHRAQST
jgi:hypothetical protein